MSQEKWERSTQKLMREHFSNDQHCDGFWSDFRVNLLIIKPLHNA